jgi:hypothetical protein
MGFAVQRDTTRRDGHSRSLYADDKGLGLTLSVFLERVPRSASAKECREFYWQKLCRSPVKMEEVKMSERGEMAILEYTVRDFGPQLPLPEDVKQMLGKFEQRHLNAHLTRGGVCIDIHLSKVLKPGDEAPPFGSLLDGVRFMDALRAGSGSGLQLPAAKGKLDALLVAKDYVGLARALGSERSDRRLGWLRNHALNGGSVFLVFHYISALWEARNRVGEVDPGRI